MRPRGGGARDGIFEAFLVLTGNDFQCFSSESGNWEKTGRCRAAAYHCTWYLRAATHRLCLKGMV